MSHYSKQIELYLDRKPDFTSEVILQDEGDGVVYIAEWNVAEEQPTMEHLETFESQAVTVIEDAKNKKIADKENAHTKLKNLGLTDDEITAITKG